MARIARVVAEGMPHHITQRGNRRQKTFFSDEDYGSFRARIGDRQMHPLLASQIHSCSKQNRIRVDFYLSLVCLSSYLTANHSYSYQALLQKSYSSAMIL